MGTCNYQGLKIVRKCCRSSTELALTVAISSFCSGMRKGKVIGFPHHHDGSNDGDAAGKILD